MPAFEKIVSEITPEIHEALSAEKDFLPFIWLAEADWPEAIGFLALNGYWIDEPDPQGSTALGAAIRLGHLDSAYWLLNAGANPSRVDARGRSALHLGAKADDGSALRLLASSCDWSALPPSKPAEDIRYDDDPAEPRRRIDALDHDGLTPLMAAAQAGNAEGVQQLIGMGADPRLFGSICWPASHLTAWRWAARNGADDRIEALLASGILSGSIDCLLLLLEAGAPPDQLCSDSEVDPAMADALVHWRDLLNARRTKAALHAEISPPPCSPKMPRIRI